MKKLLSILTACLFVFALSSCGDDDSSSSSSKLMINGDKLEKKENDMGLMETFYEGEPFTGYSIASKMTMESGSEIFMVREYSKGGVLGEFKYVNDQEK